MDLVGFYQSNEDFYTYLNRYCNQYNKTVIEAVQDRIVIEVAKKYMNDVVEKKSIILPR